MNGTTAPHKDQSEVKIEGEPRCVCRRDRIDDVHHRREHPKFSPQQNERNSSEFNVMKQECVYSENTSAETVNDNPFRFEDFGKESGPTEGSCAPSLWLRDGSFWRTQDWRPGPDWVSALKGDKSDNKHRVAPAVQNQGIVFFSVGLKAWAQTLVPPPQSSVPNLQPPTPITKALVPDSWSSVRGPWSSVPSPRPPSSTFVTRWVDGVNKLVRCYR